MSLMFRLNETAALHNLSEMVICKAFHVTDLPALLCLLLFPLLPAEHPFRRGRHPTFSPPMAGHLRIRGNRGSVT